MGKRRFEYASGSPALDLVDTVSSRGTANIELLETPGDLSFWLHGLKIVAQDVTDHDLRDVRSLRNGIFRSAAAVLAAKDPAPEDVELINRTAAFQSFRPQLIEGSVILAADDPVRAAMAMLAAEAVTILSLPNRHRIRSCPECSMIFFDKSKPGRRKWCSSSSGCGNRAKVRRFRQKQLQEGSRRDA
ncbi:CGNR zinc finger domain-containing protein [Qipengyuania qiaonensis]|uniref:CGNR zinc finger domain-containing protein n=1 Tax=Qipengyuania qiaonensis TaxID=2867240 RepID=A0ABS7J4A2_9SPHN|nr:CGNR zinc finger domain-containing protein [Qipengyuania qiaonensis]MBX7482117.1 CGNR zinc finger domain-containing protein [Qipengyuania qiaonensis]